jgi:broad specificity phosphatase PhoE
MGDPREVWLVRHGVTDANQRLIIQGQTDTALTEAGVEQARALADWLTRHDRTAFSTLLTSPLSRARRTAEILAEALGHELSEEPQLMERNFGAWEGRSVEEVYAEQDAAAGDAFDFKPPGGESTHEMATRVCAAFDAWCSRDDVGARLLVVTHGGPIGALVCRALGLEYNAQSIRRFARDNTGVTVLRRRSTAPGGFLVKTLNAAFHL